MKIIKDNKVQQDGWVLMGEVDPDQGLPHGDLMLPFSYWKQNREALSTRIGKITVFINGDNNVTELAEHLGQFDPVGVEFPAFKDGRCYSHARLLRDRYGYSGDIRAVGDVLRDQLFFMKRCGISSFAVRDDKDIDDAIIAFNDFTVTYQPASDGRPPIYKIR